MSGNLSRRRRREIQRKNDKALRRIKQCEERGRDDWKNTVDMWTPAFAVWLSRVILPKWWLVFAKTIILPFVDDRWVDLAKKNRWGTIRIWLNFQVSRTVGMIIHWILVAWLHELAKFLRTFGIRTKREMIKGGFIRVRIYAWWFNLVSEKNYKI